MLMPSSVRFLVGFVLGAAGLIAAFAAVFLVLDADRVLKAPSFANRPSFDEKLRLLLGQDVDLLNVGVQDIRINQTRFLTDFFLTQFPSVEHVVMISTTLDFHYCRPDETAFFDPEKVADYLARRKPELYFYFKYLDLTGVVTQARHIEYWRQADDTLEALSFDRHGSVLLDVPRENLIDEVWYGRPIVLDPPCYADLRELALGLRERGLPFTYVLAPMRPGYLAHRDPDGAHLAALRRGVRGALAGTGAALVDAHAALAMPEEAFFDAYHLRRDRVPALSRLVAEALDGSRGQYVVAPASGAPAADRS